MNNDYGLETGSTEPGGVLAGWVTDVKTGQGGYPMMVKFNGIVVGYTEPSGYYRTVRVHPDTYLISFEPIMRMPNLSPPPRWWQRGLVGRFFWWLG